METSKITGFVKRFDILIITAAILALIIVTFKNSLIVEPDMAMGARLMVYTSIWCIFTFVRWCTGKRWNY